jgi:hypothetical protein
MNWLKLGREWGVVLLLAGTIGCSHVQTLPSREPASIPSPASGSFNGIWQDADDPDFFLEVRNSQILIASSGQIREASTILRLIEEGLLVCEDGHEVRLALRALGERVEFFHAKENRLRRLAPIDSRPAALALSLSMPESMSLPEDEVLSIQREVRLRFESEQALFRQRAAKNGQPFPWLESTTTSSLPVQPDPPGPDLRIVDRFGANAEYMRGLVQKVGWVDAKRFGYPASSAAFFLVQHSWDLALMLSVLPRIREDVAAGLMDGSVYALMFDRVQLTLGRQQRFGSQIARNAAGEAYVLPLEHPEGVDARRKELGLQPLKEYVALFGASEVKLSSECSALTARQSEP